jgi:predicted transcriptional regulator
MHGNRPPHNDRDTSRAASESMEEAAPRLRERVFRHIKRAGPHGATCHEVERYLKLRHQTASARIWELHQKSRVKDSGYRRSTPSGRLAIVWV